MAFEQPCFKVGVINANADLSTKQYYGVKLANNSGVAEAAIAATAGEAILGILQNKPSAQGKPADIMIQGITKAVAGAAITAGAKVMVDAAGKVITLSGQKVAIGWALESAGADGDIIPILLDRAGALSGDPIGNLKFAMVNGAAAGDVTVTGIATTDTLELVLRFDVEADTGDNATGNKVQAVSDLTSEFSITAANTINNAAGTNTTGDRLLVIYSSPA